MMSINFNHICRLCMVQNEYLLPLFQDGSNLVTRIVSLTPKMKMSEDDGLPTQVCQHCVHQVEMFYNFKMQCENSDVTLRRYLIDREVSIKTEQNITDTEKQPITLDKGNEPKNKISVKPEVKEELFLDENNDVSDHKEASICDDFIDTSNESWPDYQAEPSSSKVVETNNIPKNKKQSPRHKVNTKRKKKIVKEENIGTSETDAKLADQNSSYNADMETLPFQHVKVEDGSVDKELNVKMRMKKNYMKVFQCHDCGKNFAKKAQLVLHMSGHTGAKPYICNQCCRTFASRINLKKHLFTHTGEKPYLCTHCGIFFGRIDTLTKHMRSHTGEKPFNCNVCGNSFARRSTFTNHMRTHSGEKPYLCTECGWRCVQSYDLKKHMRCHTGEKPYHCSVCRMSFGQRNSLTKHMRCHIGEVPIPMDCVKEMQFRCQVYGTKEFNNFNIPNNQPVDGQVQ
ncbi:hypothetical protein C0J52_00301 [Blattella germanica]|nr:hypothetical protein C0J52_00301 [Blattella germanica]